MSAYRLRVRQGGPGDLVAATGLVRDLAAVFPATRVSLAGTQAAEYLAHDPRVTPPDPAAPEIVVDYRPAVDRSVRDRSVRYLYAAHECFEAATGVAVPRGPARPSLVLGPDEAAPPEPGPYSVLACGSKLDIPLKAAPYALFEEVVRLTPGRRWIQVGVVHDGRRPHRQAAVRGAENRLGRTSARELLRLVAHAESVLCLVSLPMLLAAAFEVPCVAVAGGREDPWLFAGLGVEYLHTVGDGRLACCLAAGCRASFPVPAHHDAPYPPGTLCADPVATAGGPAAVGRCMTLITPAAVAAALARAETKHGRRPLAQY